MAQGASAIEQQADVESPRVVPSNQQKVVRRLNNCGHDDLVVDRNVEGFRPRHANVPCKHDFRNGTEDLWEIGEVAYG